ncbi:50S ribosomal protein L21 [bacterium]|nr:50S ribosomal protein L21 [bacterium]
MLYAIVKSGDKQFHVEIGMKIELPLFDAQPGDNIELNEVLLCSNGDEVVVGTPLIENAIVKATVLGETKGDKIVVFKMKRRKKYRNKTGHRQSFITVKINDLALPIIDNNPVIEEIDPTDESADNQTETVAEVAEATME